jgi:hypothetical protein
MMIPTEEKDFQRDTSTRALINTNVKALREHRIKKEQAARIEKLEAQMQCVLSVLQEIRTAIRDLGTGK